MEREKMTKRIRGSKKYTKFFFLILNLTRTEFSGFKPKLQEIKDLQDTGNKEWELYDDTQEKGN